MSRILFSALVLLSLTPAVFSEDLRDDEVVSYSDGNTNYKIIQLVRYVLDTTRLPGHQHIYSVLDGTVPFGDKYRHPHDPAGPVVVDCDSTKVLGVGFLVRRPDEAQYRRKQLVIRLVWTHSSVVSESEKLDHDPFFNFSRGHTRMYAREYLELFDEIKVDGVISLEASIGPDVILRNSFELTGCTD